MKIERLKDKIIATHGKRTIYWTGGIIHTLTDEDIHKAFKYKPFKLNFPSIGKRTERYWDKDYNRWVEGFEMFGLKFLKLILWNERTKYRITVKPKNEYRVILTNA